MKYTQQGFGVLEVMIVMIIMVILASLSYPRYDAQVKRSNRLEGQAFLADVAARQARYFAQNNRYVTDSTELIKLYGHAFQVDQSSTGYYLLHLEPGEDEDGGYALTAVQQFADSICGNLTLNAQGKKGYTGSGYGVEQCRR